MMIKAILGLDLIPTILVPNCNDLLLCAFIFMMDEVM